MDLSYLINQEVSNTKGETGVVTGVENTSDDNCFVNVAFKDRDSQFKFFSQYGYITKFLKLSDSSASDRLEKEVEDHEKLMKKKAAEARKTEETKTEETNTVTEVTGDNVIRFGKTHEVYGAFSNFNGPTFYDGRQYKCSEAAWQSLKTRDPAERDLFIPLAGGAAKAKGRKVKLRSDWEQVKNDLMVDVCYAKFSQNQKLKELLLSTGDFILVENTTAWHDNYWGDCQCPRCKNKPGQNHLGLALMKVRSMLREEEQKEERKEK